MNKFEQPPVEEVKEDEIKDQDKIDEELIEKYDHRGIFNSGNSENEKDRYNKIFEEIGEKGGIKVMEKLGEDFVEIYNDNPERMRNQNIGELHKDGGVSREAFDTIKDRESMNGDPEKFLEIIDMVGKLAIAGSKEDRKELMLYLEECNYDFLKDKDKDIEKKAKEKAEKYLKEALLKLTHAPSIKEDNIADAYEEMLYFWKDQEIIERLVQKIGMGYKFKNEGKDSEAAKKTFEKAMDKKRLDNYSDEDLKEDMKNYAKLAKVGDKDAIKTLEVLRDEYDENEEIKELAGEYLEDIEK